MSSKLKELNAKFEERLEGLKLEHAAYTEVGRDPFITELMKTRIDNLRDLKELTYTLLEAEGRPMYGGEQHVVIVIEDEVIEDAYGPFSTVGAARDFAAEFAVTESVIPITVSEAQETLAEDFAIIIGNYEIKIMKCLNPATKKETQ